jgi:hypothetical protein
MKLQRKNIEREVRVDWEYGFSTRVAISENIGSTPEVSLCFETKAPSPVNSLIKHSSVCFLFSRESILEIADAMRSFCDALDEKKSLPSNQAVLTSKTLTDLNLTDKEKRILKKRFGIELNDEAGSTIQDRLEIARLRIRKIEEAATTPRKKKQEK